MEQTGATIARNYPHARPDIGPILETGQCRVLVGWNHHTDTAAGLKRGKIWGWRSKGGKFQVYDTDDNRSPFAGDAVDCGPANFSMVRMFHPYWTQAGIPKDMVSADKKRCRDLYRRLMRPFELARQDRERDGDYEGNDEENDPNAYFMDRRQTAMERRRKKRKEERRAARQAARAKRDQGENAVGRAPRDIGETADQGARREREEAARRQKLATERAGKKKVNAPEGASATESDGERAEREERDSSVEIIEVRAVSQAIQSLEQGSNGGESAFAAGGIEGLDDGGELAVAGDELIGVGQLGDFGDMAGQPKAEMIPGEE